MFRTRPAMAMLIVVALATGAAREAVAAGASHVIVQGDLAKKVDAYLQRLAPFGYAGAVVVAKDGKVILQKGYGLADREKGVSVSPDTVFTIGSITKQFTGAAIVKLEMQGKLSVDDSITKYFDNVPRDKRDITIHHLLTHTSGLVNGLGGDHDLNATRGWVLGEAMKSELLWSPGKRYRYSNLGYSLLGMIVERVSGLGYEEYLREHLFKPAGMLRTGYMLPQFAPDDLAVGYRGGERWGTVLERPMIESGPCWNLRANGGIHSTVGDMYRWHAALERDDVLSEAAKKKYFAPHADEGGGGSFYGYGWVNFKTRRGTRLLAHNGGNMVFSADFRRYVDEGVAFYHTSNSSDFFVDPISDQISRILFGQTATLPPETMTIDGATLASLAGTYELNGGGTVIVRVANGGLLLSPMSQRALTLVVSGRRGGRDRFERLNERLASMIRASAAGDYSALEKAWDGRLNRVQIAQLEADDWRKLIAKFGAFKGVTVLGSRPSRHGMTTTVVRRDFEHGAEFARYVWEGKTLAGIREVAGPPVIRFAPQSDRDFVSYSLRTRSGVPVSFKLAADGTVTGMTVGKGGHALAATKKS